MWHLQSKGVPDAISWPCVFQEVREKPPWAVWGSQDVTGRDRWPQPTKNDWSSEGTNGTSTQVGMGREQDGGVAGMK